MTMGMAVPFAGASNECHNPGAAATWWEVPKGKGGEVPVLRVGTDPGKDRQNTKRPVKTDYPGKGTDRQDVQRMSWHPRNMSYGTNFRWEGGWSGNMPRPILAAQALAST